MGTKTSFLKTRRGLVILGFILITIIGIPAAVYLVQQQQIIKHEANCINNDVIWCGARTKQDIINAIENGDSKDRKDVGSILAHFGINEASINSSNTVAGRVYRDGRITIGADQVVATGAITVGREDRPGSTRCGPNDSVFCRPPSATFTSPYGVALVNVENGVFKWAILTGCGNPVIAASGPTPTSTSTPTPTDLITPTSTSTPTPTDLITPTSTSTPTVTITITETVTPTNTPTSTQGPTSTPTTPQQSTSTPVPATRTVAPTIAPSGPGNIFIGAGIIGIVLTIIGGLIFILL